MAAVVFACAQPFGWPAREFLRKLCIGKVVRFQVEYKKDTSAGVREFAAVYLADAAAPGGFSENMCVTVVWDWGGRREVSLSGDRFVVAM